MEEAKKQLVDKLKTANNILVTVSRDPNVDQLASCLGIALYLNKQGKHTAAVFSGQVPSTLEFLKPEETLEKNTDSLRDFIIALDKSKADKLRYKVEDNVVRIFITPYKTSIGQDDLEFSQGDFNVDLVLAVGVSRQEDLDEAIMAHGRILHDATVASITLEPDANLGTINLSDPQASSLSEIVTDLTRTIEPNLLDAQISTALLTGIVAATDRFKNDKTSSKALTASANLMAAGANQQLVTSQLEAPPIVESQPDQPAPNEDQSETEIEALPETTEQPEKNDGSLEIEHNDSPSVDTDQPSIDLPPADTLLTDTQNSPDAEPLGDNPPMDNPEPSQPAIDPFEQPVSNPNLTPGEKIMTEPPSLGGILTANSQPPALDPSIDPLSAPPTQEPQILEHQTEPAPASMVSPLTPPPAGWQPPLDPAPLLSDQAAPQMASPLFTPEVPAVSPVQDSSMGTIVQPSVAPQADQPPEAPEAQPEDKNEPQQPEYLSQIEEEVKASETQAASDAASEASTVDSARDEVSRALNTAEATMPPKPIEALNAQPMVDNLHPTLQEVLSEEAAPQTSPVTDNGSLPVPGTSVVPPAPSAQVVDPNAPPTVPPPIPFQFGSTPNSQQQ
jgi:hypothetical protein